MDIVAFLKPWLTDRAVWTMAATWGLRQGAKAMGLHVDDSVFVSLGLALGTWLMVHVAHVNTVDVTDSSK